MQRNLVVLLLSFPHLDADTRIGIIQTDISDVMHFTRVPNDPKDPDHSPGARVVAAHRMRSKLLASAVKPEVPWFSFSTLRFGQIVTTMKAPDDMDIDVWGVGWKNTTIWISPGTRQSRRNAAHGAGYGMRGGHALHRRRFRFRIDVIAGRWKGGRGHV
jgi:hypothetical protein